MNKRNPIDFFLPEDNPKGVNYELEPLAKPNLRRHPMTKKIQSLLEETYKAFEEIENFPIRCSGLDELFEWAYQLREVADTTAEVYGEVAEGTDLLEAWECEESDAEELYDFALDMPTPNLFFIMGADQDVDDPLLVEFLTKSEEHISRLVSTLENRISELAKAIRSEYRMAEKRHPASISNIISRQGNGN